MEQHGIFSLTLDAWTSATNIPFLGITVHYIEHTTWIYRSILIGFERLHGAHTAGALAGVTMQILRRYVLLSLFIVLDINDIIIIDSI